MKTRIILVMVLVIILLLASAVIALARTSRYVDPVSYQVNTGSITGDGYQLTHFTWQESHATGGGSYSLLVPSLPAASGSGCCCSYLPCTFRNHP